MDAQSHAHKHQAGAHGVPAKPPPPRPPILQPVAIPVLDLAEERKNAEEHRTHFAVAMKELANSQEVMEGQIERVQTILSKTEESNNAMMEWARIAAQCGLPFSPRQFVICILIIANATSRQTINRQKELSK